MIAAHRRNLAPLCFAVMFCICGCQLFEKDDEIRPARAMRVEAAEQAGRWIRISVRCSWPNGCGRYSHFTVHRNGNQFTVQVFGSEGGMATCTDNVISFIAPVVILAPSSGIVDFRFWQTDTTSIDTSLVID